MKKENLVLILLFFLINGVVFYNAIFHDPTVGYDRKEHTRYIVELSKGRLPTLEESLLAYAPPLPYILPALGLRFFSCFRDLRLLLKFAQLLNVFYSLGLTFSLLKICEQLKPKDAGFKIFSLGFLGMMPVYYKSFAFFRGEPLLAFLSVVALYLAIEIFLKGQQKTGVIIFLGVIFGLIALTRQMGLFLVAAILFFGLISIFKEKNQRFFFLKTIFLLLITMLLVGGWFYWKSKSEYGAFTAYNTALHEDFSFFHKPFEFYFGLALDKLFSDPVRDSLGNRMLPVFYSDFWGDYWCYFKVFGKEFFRNRPPVIRTGWSLEKRWKGIIKPFRLETNRFKINGYLGRVNLVSLLPTALFILAFLSGLKNFWHFLKNKDKNRPETALSLLFLAVLITLAGYFYYLVIYVGQSRFDSLKPTYILQIFPLVAVLTADFFLKIKNRLIFILLIIGLLAVFCHNFPVLLTSF